MEGLKRWGVFVGVATTLAWGAAPAPTPATTLVQSIPLETPLAHPALPFAKDVWVELIRSARRTVDVAEFYVNQAEGGAMGPVMEELEKAGKRGVKVRFIFSSRFLDQDPASIARLKAVPGSEMAIYDLKGHSRGILHAKYFLVDGTTAYLGSQNMDWRALEHIHELGIRTTDPALVKPLAEVFETDWTFARTGRIPSLAHGEAPQGQPASELVASPPFLTPSDIRDSAKVLVDLINGARHHVRVQLLVYSPAAGGHYWPVIDQALRAAAVRGVKVDLLLSDWMLGTKGMDHIRSLSMMPNTSVRIASIPEAARGHIPFARTVHSKYMVVDEDLLWVGTSNWEQDYFTDSRNVEAILRDKALAAQGTEIFQKLWSSPYTFVLDPMKNYPARKKD